MSETPSGIPSPPEEPGTPAEEAGAWETPYAGAPTEPATAGPEARMTMGGVLGEAFSLYGRFFGRFFVLAFVIFLVLNLATALAAAALLDGGGGGAFVAAISAAVAIVGGYWLQGALVFAVQDVRDGRADESIADLLRSAGPYLGTLVGAGILAGLGIVAGLILFVIPGIYLLTIWAVIAPVIVLEKTGVMAAFGRSRALVSGRFWPVFGVVIVASLISAIAQNIVYAILSFLPLFLQYWLGGAVAAAVAVPFLALAVTLTYFALRAEKGAATG